MEQNVNIQNNQYDYVIISKNICNVSSNNSNEGNSILLNFAKVR